MPIAISVSVGFSVTHLHCHDEFEILLIDSGNSQVRAGTKHYRVKAGDVIFINPMEVHSILSDKDCSYRHRCICFDASLISDSSLAQNLKNESAFVTHLADGDCPYTKILRNRFNEIFEAVENDEKTVKIEIPALITLMFACLIKNAKINTRNTEKQSSEFCRKVLQYISENYRDNITSKQAAKSLCYNPSYFCRIFRRNFAVNFSEYLNMYRMSLSRKYLEDGGSVAEVSSLCGFASAEYFTRVFKKQFGMPPSRYKKSI